MAFTTDYRGVSIDQARYYTDSSYRQMIDEAIYYGKLKYPMSVTNASVEAPKPTINKNLLLLI